MAISAGDLVATYRLINQVSPTLKVILQDLGKAEKTIRDVGGKMKDVGGSMTAAITAPLAAVAVVAVKSAVSFESAFAGVRKTVDGTEKDFAKLNDGIRELAKRVPVSAVALAGVAEAAGQLGIKKEAILGFTEVMAELGVTTNLSADEAATSLAQLANITQMPQEEFDRLGATVVALGTAGASTEKDIVSMGLRIAGAGHQIGLTEPEILGVAGALADVGIEAEAGGSAISKVMIDMALAVSKGGNSLTQFATVAGESSSSFKQLFKTDAAGALDAFVTGLARMKQSGGDVLGTLQAMGIEEVRMRDALLRLSGASDGLTKSLGTGRAAWSDNNALAKEAAERFKTTESQLLTLKNQLTDVAITLGNALLPRVNDLVEKAGKPMVAMLSDLAKWFESLPDGVQLTALALGGLAAAAGPALFVLGLLAGSLSNIIGLVKVLAPLFTTLGNTLPILTARIWLMEAAAAAGVTTLGALVSVLAALAIGYTIGTIINDAFTDGMMDQAQEVREAREAVAEYERTLGTGGLTLEEWTAKIRASNEASQAARAAYREMAAAQQAASDRSGGMFSDSEWAELKKNAKEAGAEISHLDDEQKKLLTGLQTDLQKLQATHKGAYAAMYADVNASYQQRLVQAKGVKELVAVVEKLRVAEIAAGKEQIRLSILGPGMKEQSRALEDIFKALTKEGVVPLQKAIGDLSSQELAALHNALEALGPLGTGSALWMQTLAEESSRAAVATRALAEARAILAKIPPPPMPGLANLGDAGDRERRPSEISYYGTIDDQFERATAGMGTGMTSYLQYIDTAVDRSAAWRSAINSVSDALGSLAQDMQGSWGGAVLEALSSVGSILDGLAHRAKTTSDKIAAAGAAAATAVAIYQKNSENLNGGQAALSGAASGAQAGSAFGPYGVVIGAVAGALVGFFSGSGFRKMAKEAGDVLGVEMTAGLAKAIKTTMKDLGTDVKTASLLNLDKAMGSSGKAASGFASQISQLFSLISQGGQVGTAAIEQLDKAFAALASEGTPAAAKAMADLIQQAMQLGTLTDSMMGFINDATASMAEGSTKILDGLSMIGKDVPLGDMGTAAAQMFVAGFTAEIASKGLVEAISSTGTKIQDLYQKLTDEGNTTAAAMLEPFAQLASFINDEASSDVKGFLTTLQGMGEVFAGLDKVGFVTQDAFNGLQTGIEGTANALDQAGVKGQAYYMALAPQLAQILAAHEKYGFAIDKETQGLIDQAQAAGITFSTDPMQQMIDLLGQLVVLMGGTLPESMNAIPPAADAAFGGAADAADAAAGDITGSMGEMAGAVSDSVSSLTPDIATAMDGLSGTTTTTLDEMAATVESAMDSASLSASGGLDDIASKMAELPSTKDITINVRFNSQGLPRNDDGSIDYDGDPTNSFARGSRGIRDFGGGTPAMLHGEEAVLTKDQLNAFMATAMQAGRSSGGAGDQAGRGDGEPIVLENHLYLDGQELRDWMARQERRSGPRMGGGR